MSYAQEELKVIRYSEPMTHTKSVLHMYELVARLNRSPDYLAIGEMLATLIKYCETHDRVDLVSCLEAYNKGVVNEVL